MAWPGMVRPLRAAPADDKIKSRINWWSLDSTPGLPKSKQAVRLISVRNSLDMSTLCFSVANPRGTANGNWRLPSAPMPWNNDRNGVPDPLRAVAPWAKFPPIVPAGHGVLPSQDNSGA